MARVRLELVTDSGSQVIRFVRPNGILDSIPLLRLQARVDLKPHVRPGSQAALQAAYPFCVIDTGAPLSIVPEYIWSHFFPRVVTPLPFDPATPRAHRIASVGGGSFPYELGELDVRLTDDQQRTLDVRVVAKFTRDGGRLTTPLLLGLRGGVIDGRTLRAEPSLTAAFGQEWWLEEP